MGLSLSLVIGAGQRFSVLLSNTSHTDLVVYTLSLSSWNILRMGASNVWTWSTHVNLRLWQTRFPKNTWFCRTFLYTFWMKLFGSLVEIREWLFRLHCIHPWIRKHTNAGKIRILGNLIIFGSYLLRHKRSQDLFSGGGDIKSGVGAER